MVTTNHVGFGRIRFGEVYVYRGKKLENAYYEARKKRGLRGALRDFGRALFTTQKTSVILAVDEVVLNHAKGLGNLPDNGPFFVEPLDWNERVLITGADDVAQYRKDIRTAQADGLSDQITLGHFGKNDLGEADDHVTRAICAINHAASQVMMRWADSAQNRFRLSN